jgi:hypothetical protein
MFNKFRMLLILMFSISVYTLEYGQSTFEKNEFYSL